MVFETGFAVRRDENVCVMVARDSIERTLHTYVLYSTYMLYCIVCIHAYCTYILYCMYVLYFYVVIVHDCGLL